MGKSKFRKNKFVKGIETFLFSQNFIWLTGAIYLVSAIFGLEIFAFCYTTFMVVLTCVFCRNAKPIIPMLLMVVFCISRSHIPTIHNSNLVEKGFLSSQTTVYFILALGCACAFFLLLHLIITRRVGSVFLGRGKLSVGLIIFLIALCLNGILFNGFNQKNLLIGGLEGVGFFIIYLYFTNSLSEKKVDFEYFCNCCVCADVVVIIELALTFTKVALTSEVVSKFDIYLGWGVSNNIGVVFVLTIPALMYLAYLKQNGWRYLVLSILTVIATFFTLSRASILCAICLFILCFFVVLFKAKYKVGNIVITVISLGIVVGVGYLIRTSIPKLFNFFIQVKLDDRGRLLLWQKAFEFFKLSPIFGVGFTYDDGSLAEIGKNFFFGMNTYHNTIFQILASCGIFGLLAYLIHRFQTISLFLKKPTFERFFAGMIILGILVNSLLDNHIFYFYPMFYYVLALVYAERDYNYAFCKKARLKKPFKLKKRKKLADRSIK